MAQTRLSADLVVLSACRTAGGVVVDGEGIQGLTAPLLQAGARSVTRFIDRFYRELAGGKPVIEALRGARLASIRDGEPPKVWAAFGVVGDPLVTVPLRAPAPVWGWRIAGMGLMLAGAAVAASRRRSARTRASIPPSAAPAGEG